MRIALSEAEKAYRENEVPVGAVVEYKGEVLCQDHNRREQLNSPLAHAEMLVIDKASKLLKTRNLKECTIYVTLEPCPMCAGAILMANFDKCIFGAADKKQGCMESVYCLCEDPSFYNNVFSCGGLLENESVELLKNFFKERR
ncbi:MAG: nucleoside deaminase [Eubacteriales bacterium]|nr:nucleoside deaminase [Eubacteriales bacterium]